MSLDDALKAAKLLLYISIVAAIVVAGFVAINLLIDSSLQIAGPLPTVAEFIILLDASPGPLTFALSLNFAIEVLVLAVIVLDRAFNEVIRGAEWFGKRIGWIHEGGQVVRTKGSLINDLSIAFLLVIACILMIGYVYS